MKWMHSPSSITIRVSSIVLSFSHLISTALLHLLYFLFFPPAMHAAARGAILSSRSSSARLSHSRRVFIEISNAIRGSNIQRRGKSFAASVPSDSSKPQKAWRKVPIHERRAMVESFVQQYRISNAGKFPTASTAKKQVGGSYYVIRQILQEIQYEYKLSSANKKAVKLETVEEVVLPHFDAKEESQVSTTDEEVSNSVTTVISSSSSRLEGLESSSMKIIDNPKIDGHLIPKHDEATSEYFTSKEDPMVSILDGHVLTEEASDHDKTVMSAFSKSMEGAETPSITCQISNASLEIKVEEEDCHSRMTTSESLHVENVVSARDQSHQIKLESEVLQPPEGAEYGIKDRMTVQGSDGPKGESVLKDDQEAPESENFDRRTSKLLPSEKEPSVVRSTVWGNLKHLADGIINFWRKM